MTHYLSAIAGALVIVLIAGCAMVRAEDVLPPPRRHPTAITLPIGDATESARRVTSPGLARVIDHALVLHSGHLEVHTRLNMLQSVSATMVCNAMYENLIMDEIAVRSREGRVLAWYNHADTARGCIGYIG